MKEEGRIEKEEVRIKKEERLGPCPCVSSNSAFLLTRKTAPAATSALRDLRRFDCFKIDLSRFRYTPRGIENL